VLGITALMDDPVFASKSPDRYIPDAYKYNNIYGRMELLRGLLDSDGEVHGSGAIGFSTTSKTLADDVVWLVRSLGGKAMLQPKAKSGWYPGADG
jgi:ATP-dependent DNA helicase RecG